ncbi:hypothetical protein, partial [Klebsiella pneumoniae]|uniref:hypothetical protein n=1 Tax=Klebsiella pneumoniae TaxID=573 RepID=UPI0025A07D05
NETDILSLRDILDDLNAVILSSRAEQDEALAGIERLYAPDQIAVEAPRERDVQSSVGEDYQSLEARILAIETAVEKVNRIETSVASFKDKFART